MQAAKQSTASSTCAAAALTFRTQGSRFRLVQLGTAIECSSNRVKMECARTDVTGTANTARVGAKAREQQVSTKKTAAQSRIRFQAWTTAPLATSASCFSAAEASFGAGCSSGCAARAEGRSSRRK